MDCRRAVALVPLLTMLLLVAVLASVPTIESVSANSDAPAPSSQSKPGHSSDRLLVKFKVAQKAHAVASKHGASIKRFYDNVGIHLVALPPNLPAKVALERFARDPDVKEVSLDYIIQLDAIPNDPSFGELWGLHNTGQSGGTTDADIDAPEAWSVTTGSPSVVVGVIDTGVYYSHQDLAANMWTNPGEIPGNGIDDDANGYADDIYGIDAYNGDSDPMDDNNHGTHVSGTIGAVGNNGVGVAGVNWHVKIIALKFLGSGGSGYTSGAIECINYALTMKSRGVNIRVLSNSWGGGGFSTALRDAIQAAANADILFVAAAGNSASSNDASPHYPSSYDVANVLAVASTDRNDQRSSFSNYGLTSVHVAAPGSNVLSTVRGNQYASYSGTSMATPHVSGVAALILAADPNLSYLQVKKLILFTSDSLSSLSDRILTGGRVNANNALGRSGNSLRIFRTLTTLSAFVGDTVSLEVMAGLYADPVPGMTVTADFSDGSPRITLGDSGITPDTASDDGVFTASWTPSSSGLVTITFTASASNLAPAVTTVSGAIARSYKIASAPYSWTEISTAGTPLELGDDSIAMVSLPISVRFAGQSFSSLTVSANGFVSLSNQDAGYSNKALPTAGLTNLIAVYWDDLIGRTAIDRGVAYWQVSGSEPYRQLIVEWKDFAHYANPSSPGSVTFQVTFYEHREDVLMQYQSTTFGDSGLDRGASATVGIQLGGSTAIQYSYNSANSITDASAILFGTGRALGSLHEDIPEEARVTPVLLDAAPPHFDWREKDGYNWMTSVKDQASCGSCVAFGAVAALEGQLRIQTKNPSWNLDLSEQHLFSCGGGSCSYGWYVSSALNYLQQYGTPDEACSPYKAQSGSTSCASSCSDWQSRAYKISGWNWVAANPSAIQAALLNGPLVAAFDVYTDFFYYSGGVYHYTWGVYEGGHAVTIVGYDQPGQYWIVKNSWGASWGENGYFRIEFGQVGIEEWVASTAAVLPNSPPVITGLSADMSSPQTVGTSIVWTATASDPDDSTLYYRFWKLKQSSSWVMVRDWGTSNTYSWVTASGDIGSTMFGVWVRDAHHAGTNAGDAYGNSGSYFQIIAVTTTTTSLTTTTLNMKPTIASFVSDKSAPQVVGAIIVWTVTPTDPDDSTLYYRFWKIKQGGSWQMVQDWSSSNTYSWATTSADVGGTMFGVWVRDGHHAGPDASDDYGNSGSYFQMLAVTTTTTTTSSTSSTASTGANQKPVITGLSADKPSPQVVGTIIVWTAVASDPDDSTLYYRFWKLKQGVSWTMVQDWSTSNTYSWVTGSGDVGGTMFGVWVRDGHHAGPDAGDDYGNSGSYFQILAVTTTTTSISSTTSTRPNVKPTIVRLLPDKPSPQVVGASIVWTVTASDPDDVTLYCRFWKIKQGGSWQMVQDWSTSNTYSWATGSGDVGGTMFGVWVRDGHHAGPDAGDDYGTSGSYFQILTATTTATSTTSSTTTGPNVKPTIIDFSVDKSSPQVVGASIVWTVTASDPDDSTLHYRFWKIRQGGSWQMVRDWDTSNQFTWVTGSDDVGGTMFGVWVRDGHHAGPDAGDVYGTSGSYFQILAAGSADTSEQGMVLLSTDLFGLLGLSVLTTGLAVRKKAHGTTSCIGSKRLSVGGQRLWRSLRVRLVATRRFSG